MMFGSCLLGFKVKLHKARSYQASDLNVFDLHAHILKALERRSIFKELYVPVFRLLHSDF